MPTYELVSHHLCPYVQRAAIVLLEKAVPFTRTLIDLGVLFAEVAPRSLRSASARRALTESRAEATRRAYTARLEALAKQALPNGRGR